LRIGLFHGWELSGSGSNEYVRYLGRTLAAQGHQVQVFCREPRPEKLDEPARAFLWEEDGSCRELFHREGKRGFTLHVLPHHPAVRPVYVTDKQRSGPVKAFTDLSEEELWGYLEFTARVLGAALEAFPVDILQANHLVPQPWIAARACGPLGIPYFVYPHGSSIEYTLRRDERFLPIAREGVEKAEKLVIGSREVRDRIARLLPELSEKIMAAPIVGVGVDTSLFAPLSRKDRPRAIEAIRALSPGGGKTRAQERELRERVFTGDLEAVKSYRRAYDHSLPDAHVLEKLDSIPWDRARVLFFVGALTSGKGVQSLIGAMPSILAREPEACLLIVGSGAYREVLEAFLFALAEKEEDLARRLILKGFDLEETALQGPWADLASWIADPAGEKELFSAGRKLLDQVHFLGRMDHTLLSKLFPCADLAIFPSLLPEAYPLVLMESLSAGVLPMATDFSGFKEGLDELEPNLGKELVDRMRIPHSPGGRIQALANQATTLLSLLQARDPASTLARIARENYDWTVRARQMFG